MAVLAPVSLVIVVFLRVSSIDSIVRSLIGIALTAGLHLIVMRTVRDRGNNVQRRLWRDWGGHPTAQRLRWREHRAAEIQQLHRRVESMTGVKLPTAADERDDPLEADDVYEDAVGRMREMTRDHARFPRVYSELLQYGTARNLYGAKPYGLAAASAALVAATSLAIVTATTTVAVSWWSIAIAAIGALVMLAIWLFRISPDYVRPASDRYADALLATANEPGAQL